MRLTLSNPSLRFRKFSLKPSNSFRKYSLYAAVFRLEPMFRRHPLSSCFSASAEHNSFRGRLETSGAPWSSELCRLLENPPRSDLAGSAAARDTGNDAKRLWIVVAVLLAIVFSVWRWIGHAHTEADDPNRPLATSAETVAALARAERHNVATR